MKLIHIWGVLGLTFRESIRAKWLIIFTVLFFLLAINIPYLVAAQGHVLPESYLATFLTSLISVAFPIIPLLALPMAAASIVDERESGTLVYVLSNPVSKEEFFIGKATGLVIATTLALIIGFGAAAVVSYGTNFSQYVGMDWLIGLAVLLNAAMLGIGLIISEFANRKATAIAVALFAWLLYTAVSDVQTLSLFLNARFGIGAPVGLTLMDPVEMARLATVMGLGYSDAQWGNLGLFAYDYFHGSTFNMLFAAVAIWAVATLVAGFLVFRKQDVS